MTMRIITFALFLAVVVCVNPANAMAFTMPPLHQAAYLNNTMMLTIALQDTKDINQPSANGVTALHVAAYEGKKEAAQMLLEHGANPDIKDDKGRTPLDLAFEKNHLALITLLIPVTDKEGKTAVNLTSPPAPEPASTEELP